MSPARPQGLSTRLDRRRALAVLAAAGLGMVRPGLARAASAPPAPASSPTFTPWWVQNFRDTHLWSGPTDPAVDYGVIPQWSYLLVVRPQDGPRLYVYVPWTKNYAYVDAASVGPSGAPPPGWTPPPLSSPNWLGRVAVDTLILRTAPTTRAPIVRTLPGGTRIEVVAWVAGDEVVKGNWTWARLPDGTHGYSAALTIVPPEKPPPPPANHPSGRWIDINLLHQVAVAYEDQTPVHLAVVSTGSPGWETPTGTFQILRRVADETMRGSTLTRLGLDALQLARADYDLPHVLYTQYFDWLGDALHDNYWLPDYQFGIPRSHGCVGMRLADAKWFWDWADYGTPVVIHPR